MSAKQTPSGKKQACGMGNGELRIRRRVQLFESLWIVSIWKERLQKIMPLCIKLNLLLLNATGEGYCAWKTECFRRRSTPHPGKFCWSSQGERTTHQKQRGDGAAATTTRIRTLPSSEQTLSGVRRIVFYETVQFPNSLLYFSSVCCCGSVVVLSMAFFGIEPST